MSKFQRPHKKEEKAVAVRSEASRMPTIVDVFDRASVRLTLILVPIAMLTFLLSVAAIPYLAPVYGESVAKEITSELKGRVPSNPEVLSIIQRYGLSWLYVTDKHGDRLPSTAAFSPPTQRTPNKSMSITIRKRKYYEAIVPLGENRLHVGFSNDSQALQISIASPTSLIKPIPFGVLLLFIFVLLVSAFLITESITAISIFMLGSTIDKLTAMIGNKYSSDDIRKVIKLTWATSEVRALGSSLFVMMRKISESMELVHKDEEEARKLKERKRKAARLTATGTYDKTAVKATQGGGVVDIQVERVLATATSSYDYASKLLDSVNTIFGDIVEYAAFMKIEENGNVKIEKVLGFTADDVEMLRRIDHRELTDERTITKRSIEMGPMQIKRLGFEPIARQFDIGNIVYLPLTIAGKGVAFLCMFIHSSTQLKPEKMRALESFRDKVVGIYAQITEKEKLEEERWLDPLTGLGNMTYFQELMPRVLERTREHSSSGSFTIALVGLDFSAPDLVRFPNEMRQRWIAEVGQVLQRVLPVSKRLEPERGANTYLARYHDDIIACVIEGVDATYNITQIEGIQTVLTSRNQWAGGITSIPFAIAVASYPNDGNTSEMVIRNADKTLSYIREMMGGIGLFNASDVPADYTPKEATEIAGTLGVLDAADLLQSIAASENDGILTVENELGQQFVCSWREGKPLNASLGAFQGMNAVAEFIITFKTGHYNFQQRKPTMTDEPTQLYSIEYCLMEAALYEDKMNAARKVIPNAGIIVRTIDNSEAYNTLQTESDVTAEELEVIQMIAKYAQAGAPLESIFQKLDRVPSFVKWRAAALMIESSLLEWQWPTM